MKPADHFKLKVIGKITMVSLTMTNLNNNEISTLPECEYEVIEKTDEIYVCNVWYDEGKYKPLWVTKNLVKSYEGL